MLGAHGVVVVFEEGSEIIGGKAKGESGQADHAHRQVLRIGLGFGVRV